MCVKPSNCRVGRATLCGAKPTERNPPNETHRTKPTELNPPRLGNGGFSFAGLRLRYAPTHPTSKKNVVKFVLHSIGKRYILIEATRRGGNTEGCPLR